MNELIDSIAQSTAIIMFFCICFGYIVLRPLNSAIKDLNKLIDAMSHDLKLEHEKREEMYRRLVAVEQQAKSAHHRIDRLEGREMA